MDTLIVDPHTSARLIEERRARGADRFDEVWEGTYLMAPAPNDEHQDLGGGFTEVLRTVFDRVQVGTTRPGINLTSDPNDWEHNYRVPDVAVFLKGSPAVCHGAFWSGPPDFIVEIVSPYDKTREKLNFYGKLGTRELLIVDRDPWRLELHRLQRGKLRLVTSVVPGDLVVIESDVLPLRFRLLSGEPRPVIEVIADNRVWTI
ncbi:MAG: Uma2 family endonuclease [Pirellulales bacterium]